MKILIWIVGILMALVGLCYLAGMTYSREQSYTRTIELKQPPEAVFALLSDVENMPTWNDGLEKVEIIPPIDGKQATRQTCKGNLQMTIVTTESHPPSHLIRTMGDEDGPFVGSWTYNITDTPSGSQVALTEDSNVRNPFTRLMMKIMGPTKYMDAHLQGLAKHFGETAVIR
ncbi:hypothetical protein BH20VER1_BH20VER1_10730 [soil metagenome]